MAKEKTDELLLSSDKPQDFEAFYARHLDVVTRYVARRTTRADLTIDVVAETFARALQRRAQFDQHRGPAIGWVLTIARNVLIDSARRGRVADETRLLLRMQPMVLDDADLTAVEDRSAGPLVDALQALPADQRDAISRRILDEDSYPLIAADVGCSEQVVRQRVHRGLRTIRQHIKEQQA